MSLKNQTLSGMLWNSISYASLKGINFIISIILARLLEPSDFGVVGVALVFLNFFEIARDLGIGTALIHRQKDIDIAANTAFFIFPVVAIFLYSVAYVCAPMAAIFFNNPDVEIVIRVLGITLVLWSFGNLPKTLLCKDLQFKKLMIPQIIPRIGYGLISIILAFIGYGVWSLVIGRLVLEVLSLITIWQSIDWRPKFKFDKKIAIELLNYGKYALGANIIAFVISAMDISVVGKYLGSEDLGYYSIAISISTFFTLQISMIISQVLFPAYSKIQNIEKVGEAYLKTLRLMSLITFPAAFGIIGTSWYFVKVLLGEKWLPIVTVLQILCICGISKSILKVSESLYLASGNVKVTSRMNLLQLIFIGLLIIPFSVKYGINGTGLAVAIPSIITLLLILKEASKIIKRKLSVVMKPFLHPFIGSFIMLSLMLVFQKVFWNLQPPLVFVSSIVIGTIVYWTYVLINMRPEFKEFIATLNIVIPSRIRH